MTATTWTMRLARMLGDELANVVRTEACEQRAADIDGGISDAAVAAIAALPPGPRRDPEGRELAPVRGGLIPYLTVRNKFDKETRRPGQRHAGTWSEIASMLTTHTVLRHKDHALGFVPLTMADTPCTCGDEKCPGELGHLTESNVRAFNMLMLDLDKYRDGLRQLDVDAIMAIARAAQAAQPPAETQRSESSRPRHSYTPRGDEFDIRAAMARATQGKPRGANARAAAEDASMT